MQHYEDAKGEAIFRSWMQKFPSIRFLFSGSQRDKMQAMFAEKNRPFYRSSQLLPLQAIPLDAYLPFIQKHFSNEGKSIDSNCVEVLYKWSRGQTYCVELICNKLFARHNNAKIADLEEVYTEILNQESAVFDT